MPTTNRPEARAEFIEALGANPRSLSHDEIVERAIAIIERLEGNNRRQYDALGRMSAAIARATETARHASGGKNPEGRRLLAERILKDLAAR